MLRSHPTRRPKCTPYPTDCKRPSASASCCARVPYKFCLTLGWRCETGPHVCCAGIPAGPPPRPACVVTDPSHPHSICPCRVPVWVLVLVFPSHSSRACCLALRVFVRPPVRPCARIQRLYVCVPHLVASACCRLIGLSYTSSVLLGLTYSRPVCRVLCERGCAMCWHAFGLAAVCHHLGCCRCMPNVASSE